MKAKLRRLSLTYVVVYLTAGGLGFSFMPALTLKLFFSNRTYEPEMVQLVGTMMLALAFLVGNILRNHDEPRYYGASIILRGWIVVILGWLYFKSSDPVFLVINGIVLLGLLPSIVVHSLKET